MNQGSLSIAALALCLSGCATVPAGQDVATSWDKALVFSPERAEASAPAQLRTTKKYPTLILMHGCTGIEPGSEGAWAGFIRDMGFVVVVPDSLARADRGPSCDSRIAQNFGGNAIHAMRLQEIDYAMAKVRESPWVDQRNIFLMGHSDGGVAAARTRRGDFNGIIISGWTCNAKYASYKGIFSPPSVPVLSLLWTWDRWFPSGDLSGTCEKSLEGRAGSKHVSLDGANHNTFPSPLARDEVVKFLRSHLR